jgi:hypothetical protein
MTRFLSASACAALPSIPQAALDPRREVHDYLTKSKFTADELASFDAGDVVARASVIKSAEILVVSAVKILVSRDRVLDY